MPPLPSARTKGSRRCPESLPRETHEPLIVNGPGVYNESPDCLYLCCSMSARRRASPYGTGRPIRRGTVSNGRFSNSSWLPWTTLRPAVGSPSGGTAAAARDLLAVHSNPPRGVATLHQLELLAGLSLRETRGSTPFGKVCARTHDTAFAIARDPVHLRAPAGRALVPGKPLCAHSGQASVRPLWACFGAPFLGTSLCAHSGQASCAPSLGSLCALIAGRPRCAHSGKSLCDQFGYAFGRPFWASLRAPIRDRLLVHPFYRQASVLPFWAGLCAPIPGKLNRHAHSEQALARPFKTGLCAPILG